MPAVLLSSLSSSDGSAPGSPQLKPSSKPPLMAPDIQLEIARSLLSNESASPVTLSGSRLTLGDVVAAARHRASVKIDDTGDIKGKIEESVLFLKSKGFGLSVIAMESADFFRSWQLSTSIYGVTTGFGGSADTRTDQPLALQLALLEHQLCGVLPISPELLSGRGLENCMPEEVVRGAMLIRINSLARGHSAVRLSVLETLVRFLEEGITPVVPLRGSISASGDLSPLSYIAGAITGHPDIRVITRKRGKFEILTAPEALELHGILKVVMGPKEGLGLVNGTAVSASMATLALHDTHFLALLSQALTALTVEAMVGHVGSFHPFIHDITRPHPGQIEVARNIRTVLQDSAFAIQSDAEVGVKEDEGILRQDRYPLRTAAQWLGPALTDLVGSTEALRIELNSTTDNPLIDVRGGIVHSGGNFQAMAVTNTMEKTRLSVAQMGKLSFAQMTEMVNSLALISARKTVEANEVLTMLMSTHLYCCCQALDLRYIEFKFRDSFNPSIHASLTKHFSTFLSTSVISTLALTVQSAIWRRLETTTSTDLVPRWEDAFAHTSSMVLDALSYSSSVDSPIPAICAWRKESAAGAILMMRKVREEFFAASTSPTTQYLGRGTQGLYTFVREAVGLKARRGDVFLGKQEQTVGTGVSKIFEAIRSGKMNEVLVNMMA
ncbi:phenylalanine ammonia-lyase, partial [Phenoliferia sp. Uapishka_3]